MQQDILRALLDRYITGDLTAAERIELATLAASPANRLVLEEFVKQVIVSGKYGEEHDPKIKERLDAFIDTNVLVKRIEPAKDVYLLKLPWLRYSAAIVLVVAAIFYVISSKRNFKETVRIKKPTQKHSILPGTNVATLTLADGSVILLDSAVKGSVAQQGSTKIIQLAPGHITYTGGSHPDSSAAMGYNTISTPKGGQYQVILSDGSHVWLNAASSLRFPAFFGAAERKVEVTGEVYVEVAKDTKKPFKVKAGNQNIEVLGTGFNINAYEDENAVKTTLAEGSIKITYDDESYVLQPGKQSIMSKNGSFNIIQADVSAETAWKNGLFQFAKADIKSVMRQISRWYNVDIHYSGKIPDMKFTGEIQKDLNLEDVLAILDDSGVDLNLDGRTLKIM